MYVFKFFYNLICFFCILYLCLLSCRISSLLLEIMLILGVSRLII